MIILYEGLVQFIIVFEFKPMICTIYALTHGTLLLYCIPSRNTVTVPTQTRVSYRSELSLTLRCPSVQLCVVL